MATQTLSTFDALLKNVYRGPLVELLNQETYMIDQLEKQNVNELGTFTGRNLIFPVHTGRNAGRGATTDGGGLAVAGKQSYLDATVPIKYFNAGIELTDMVVKQASSDEGSFVRALTSEMDGAATDLRKTINRMVYGTGDGLLASCTASQTSTVISVDSGQFIPVGDVVDVLRKTDGAVVTTGVSVSAVSYTGAAASSTQANANITLPNSVTVTSAHGVYLSGDRSNESDGLRNITNTGRVLFNIDSSSNPIWDGNVKDAANSNPTEDLLMQLAQTIRQKSGKAIDTFVTTYGIQRRLAGQYATQKRWTDSQVTNVTGGYSAIMVASGAGAIPVVADVDCPSGFVFALNKGSFAWSELESPDWLSPPNGGGILVLKDAATAGQKVASWQGWFAWYATLVNVAPLRNGQIKNVNDDIPIPRI